MDFPGFIDASYRTLSKYATVERCVNWFLETVETAGETKTKKVLYPTPCTGKLFEDFSNPTLAKKARSYLELNGRKFAINGDAFFEFTLPTSFNPNGTFTQYGTVIDDGNPAMMIANGVINPGNQQIFISSADRGYIFQTKTNTFNAIGKGNGFIAGRGAAFLDDFFVSIIPGTNGVQVCTQNNGLVWTSILGQSIAYAQGQSDYFVNLIANVEYLYLFGARRSEIWYNQGGTLFPFSIQQGAFIEMGLGGEFAFTQADNSIFFLGQDARGGRSFWRLNGLTPVRVSTYAVELALQKYVTVSDCVLYAFLWRGHVFVRCIFPSAGAGWEYDVTESAKNRYPIWHELNFTDLDGRFVAPLERTHMYSDGIHIVGSGGAEGRPGTPYQFTDDTIIAQDPVVSLRYSNSGGKEGTFSPEREVPVGKAGEYEQRVIADLLGSGRDRVFWLRCIDYGDAGGTHPVTRDRICPHIFNENKRVFYERLEIECQKGIGRIDLGNGTNATNGFWALVNAYLTLSPGLN